MGNLLCRVEDVLRQESWKYSVATLGYAKDWLIAGTHDPSYVNILASRS